VLPEVRPCQENVFDDRDRFRLPRDQSEPYFSLNLPIEKVATPDEQCGRLVHSNLDEPPAPPPVVIPR
jgi:hypothetical protein